MPTITINGNTLDPHGEESQLKSKSLLAADAEKTDHILIQTEGPLSTDDKAQLSGLKAEVEEYVSENTYLVEYLPTDLEAIRKLTFVKWANIYNKQFKVEARLKGGAGTKVSSIVADDEDHDPNDSHNVEIIFHKNVKLTSEIVSEVASKAGVSTNAMSVKGHKISVVVKHEKLNSIASLDGVKAVQEIQELTLFNSKARSLIAADPILDGTTFRGDGQVVAVADTGFDIGSATDVLPAFAGRVVKLWALGRTGLSDDPHGHGTHVAGSVLGDGVSPTLDDIIIQGTAPEAQLAFQSLLDAGGGLGGIPADLKDLFQPPYNDGNVRARVHTNSWGPRVTALPYGRAYQADKFVWDNQDMVILFAAGNEGVDTNYDGKIDQGQIGSYGSAKNTITVGASENDRPGYEATWENYGYSELPLKSDRTADNPHGMAGFSNRGYTPNDCRIKPDLVAPGTAILSATSRHPDVRGKLEPLSDPDWRFDSGTSMATPLVAGAAAVVREAFTKKAKLDFIPAALVKAALINGAEDLIGQYIGPRNDAGPSPNPSSGWGRVNLNNAVSVVSGGINGGYKVGVPLEQGAESRTKIDIPKLAAVGHGAQAPLSGTSGQTLKITLVWTDPPGEILQNDLDLIVIGSDGKEYHGNVGYAVAGDRYYYDRLNNVEQIRWVNVPQGEAQIIIRAYRITKYAQPWAYVWSLKG